MRTLLPALLFALTLGITIVASVALTPTPVASVPLHASAVNLNLNYSDPASDVFILYTSNNSHVTDAAGNWLYSNTEGQVNILRLFSVNGSTAIGVYLRVQGGSSISNLPNTSYEVRLYTHSDNSTHFILRYTNGSTTLRTNLTGSAIYNLTANTTIGPSYQLGIEVSKAYLGTLTTWNIDGSTKMTGPYYTFEDFGWLQPGNPGSAPAVIQGQVRDANSNAGLANATVTTGPGGYSTRTNATGYYSLPTAPGTYNLTFSLAGYENLTKQVSVNLQQTQTVNAALTPVPGSAGIALWLWVAVAVVIFAVIALVLFLAVRGRQE